VTKKLFAILLCILFFLSACSGTFSSAPTPTPTLTPTPTPTSTPIPPTATSTPTSTATPTPTPVPGGPCDNPLIPLRQGNEWLYTSTGAKGVTRLKVAIGAVGEDRAEITMMNPDTGQTIRDVIMCSNGDITRLPIFLTSLLLADYVDHVLNTYYLTGVDAPSYPTLAQNNWRYTWKTEYLLEEDVFVKFEGSTLRAYFTPNAIFKYQLQVGNVHEAVSVPAGAYPQALRVSQAWQSPINLMGLPDVQATGVAGVFTMDTVLWYEPYIGLLKAQVAAAEVWVPGILQVPLALDRVIELVSFTPGQ
jgi:hypothetical protein